jgi:hypothetical protein
MGLSKMGTHQFSRLTWRVISGDEEKILNNCQNEPNSNFFLKFQVDSAPMVPKKNLLGHVGLLETNVNNIWSCDGN